MSDNTFPSYKVAAIQTEPEIGNKQKNVSHMVEQIRTAAGNGALLTVLPELANTGYVFNSREEAFSLAETIPDGETCKVIGDLARELKIYIVFGITERDGNCLYNSAAFFGPDGFIGKYRKNHLWCDENLFFEAGNLGMPVYKTPIGRIGMLICYDGWFPELYRLASMQGADIICTCTNWVPMAGQPENCLAMANILAMGSAHVNSLNVICADRVGTERDQPFLGQSIVVGPEGWLLAGPASKSAEEIIYADINIKKTRAHRQTNAFNNIVRDRRDDLYDPMLGADMDLTRW
ncbi:MAG: nitrilase family protein [Aeromonadales bacterium]|nr:nitrilase family protein [Aeromonadales bacterium]MDY2891628.1 nitrilase family protein [Succinivibrio sp.]